eukprot:TRINITY_DN38504_c0_g1_i1.p1 TRINITY_DN38504_c0_g1~~TRINITY_DN38504_c0_g1_i1.p1  ORF type:complete len:198 (+),score=22.56 TRINITY_DN38504_c0_g1_i1:85-678(+)
MVARHDYLFRLRLIGDRRVGKSCLLLRFADDTWEDSGIGPLAVDFKNRTLEQDGKSIQLQIWDSAANERFVAIRSSLYRGVRGIVIVYDVTVKETFDNIMEWVQEVQNYAPDCVNTLLVGNKCDLSSERVVSYNEAKELADSLGIHFVEISAKNGHNVEQALQAMTLGVMQRAASQQPQVAECVTLGPRRPVSQGRC